MVHFSRSLVLKAAAPLLAAGALAPAGVAAVVAGSAGPLAAKPAVVTGTSSHRHDSALAKNLAAVNRTTAWTQLSKLKLAFPTFHPEGLAVTEDRFYLSSVEIIEPTQKYPTPVDGFDRTPGKGVGHLFVIDRQGKLIKDVVLGHDIVYHPGGIELRAGISGCPSPSTAPAAVRRSIASTPARCG